VYLNPKMNSYTCETCSYSTKIKGSINKHLNTKKCKSKRISEFKCEECDIIFYDNNDLQKHISKKCKFNNNNNNNNNPFPTVNGFNNNVDLNIGAPFGVTLTDTLVLKDCVLKLLETPKDLNDPNELANFKSKLQEMLLEKNIIMEVL